MKILRILFLIALMVEIVFFLRLADGGINVLPSDDIGRNPLFSSGIVEPDVPFYLPGDAPLVSREAGIATSVLIIAEAQRMASGE